MALITNESLLAINAELERKNRLLMRFANKYARTSWLDLRNKVRGGTIAEYLVVGDILLTTYAFNGTEYEMPWLVVNINREVEWEDGTKHPGLFLLSEGSTIQDVEFDAAENNVVDLELEPNALAGWYYWGQNGNQQTRLNVNTGDQLPTNYSKIVKCMFDKGTVLNSGLCIWEDSAVRQWLNSGANRGEWWEPQHSGDLEPSTLSIYDGFMFGLDPDFLNVLTPIKVKTAIPSFAGGGTSVTLDTFFLPSVEELYGIPETPNVEGPFLPYFKEVTGFTTPSNTDTDGRAAHPLNSSNRISFFTRSASESTCYVYAVNSKGAIKNEFTNYISTPSNRKHQRVMCAIS